MVASLCWTFKVYDVGGVFKPMLDELVDSQLQFATYIYIYIYDTYLCEVTCGGMSTTKWSSAGSRCASLLPRRCFVMQKLALLHLVEICDGRLSAFSLPLDPVAPLCGHLQVLFPGPARAAVPRGTLARKRWRPPFGRRTRRCPNRAAAVKRRYVLVPELLPFNVGGVLSWHFALEIEVPALVGRLHVRAEQPLEVLLQLLVVHGPEEVPPHRPHLHLQVLNASQAWELGVIRRSWSCCWCWWSGHRHVPSASICQSIQSVSTTNCAQFIQS